MQLLEKMPETSRVRNQIPDTRRAYLDIWEESYANRSKNSETVREAPVCYEVGEERLNPLNDYLFSQYMGTEECRVCLISFLNAVLEEEVKEVEIIKNIIQRSQYYNGRLYISGIAMGEDYKKLGRVISINILAYNGLDYPEYHLSSHFRIDQHPEDILSPYQEIHFLQLKKFYRSGEYDPGNPLHR
ncbi:MAG TPA: hypothetical protein GXX75_13085 [Clostridiales bacterium]|nr:hypothetical protein [Clostridiales bacterium]